MENDTCQIEGCGKPRYQARRLCGSHAMRLYRYGDPLADRRKHRQPCVVDGCEMPASGHGWCKAHYDRWRRCGDPTATFTVQTVVRYGHAHHRVRQIRGPAPSHSCVDCGAQAAHWSYDHNDPAELVDDAGPYSLDSGHYEPRCVRCHKRFDRAYLLTQ